MVVTRLLKYVREDQTVVMGLNKPILEKKINNVSPLEPSTYFPNWIDRGSVEFLSKGYLHAPGSFMEADILQIYERPIALALFEITQYYEYWDRVIEPISQVRH